MTRLQIILAIQAELASRSVLDGVRFTHTRPAYRVPISRSKRQHKRIDINKDRAQVKYGA